MTNHRIGTRDEWLEARLELLKAEKELTRLNDDKRDRLFARAAEHYPQLAQIARKTERVIPMVVLTPRPNT
jgi:predicted dithiol-disulfide oxidoreductase (DUF899 family)